MSGGEDEAVGGAAADALTRRPALHFHSDMIRYEMRDEGPGSSGAISRASGAPSQGGEEG